MSSESSQYVMKTNVSRALEPVFYISRDQASEGIKMSLRLIRKWDYPGINPTFT